MPERRGELELSLQPVVERPSFRFAFLLPDEIGAHRDFSFGCFRTSVGHTQFLHFHRPLRLRHIVDRLSISTFQNLAKIDRQLFLSGRSPESDGKLSWIYGAPRRGRFRMERRYRPEPGDQTGLPNVKETRFVQEDGEKMIAAKSQAITVRRCSNCSTFTPED